MKHCIFTLGPLVGSWRVALMAGMMTLCTTGSAQMAVRQFPAAALRGVLEVTDPPTVLINGTPARLSPGARIKGVHNLIVLSGTLVGQRVLVNYVRDSHGLLHDVWILNEQEAQEKRNGMATFIPVTFSSAATRTDDGTTSFDELPTLVPR